MHILFCWPGGILQPTTIRYNRDSAVVSVIFPITVLATNVVTVVIALVRLSRVVATAVLLTVVLNVLVSVVVLLRVVVVDGSKVVVDKVVFINVVSSCGNRWSTVWFAETKAVAFNGLHGSTIGPEPRVQQVGNGTASSQSQTVR